MSIIHSVGGVLRQFKIGSNGNKKKGRAVAKNGKVTKIAIYQRPPKGCSTPRQLCVRCKRTRIAKQSALFEVKVCRGCGGMELLSECSVTKTNA